MTSENAGWQLLRELAGVQTFVHKGGRAGGHVRAIVQGEIEAEFFPLLSLFHEVDLFTTWMPRVLGYGVSRSLTKERKSVTELVAY